MASSNTSWNYVGPEININFDDIIIQESEEVDVPSSLKPTNEMMDRFHKNCEDEGLLEETIL